MDIVWFFTYALVGYVVSILVLGIAAYYIEKPKADKPIYKVQKKVKKLKPRRVRKNKLVPTFETYMHSLETEAWRINESSRKLTASKNKIERPIYLKYNTHMQRATSLISGLRESYNYRRNGLYLRHLNQNNLCLCQICKQNNLCQICNDKIEDEIHLLEECTAYEEIRKKFHLKLKRTKIELNFSIIEIVLCDPRYEHFISKYDFKLISNLDKISKIYVEEITNLRNKRIEEIEEKNLKIQVCESKS